MSCQHALHTLRPGPPATATAPRHVDAAARRARGRDGGDDAGGVRVAGRAGAAVFAGAFLVSSFHVLCSFHVLKSLLYVLHVLKSLLYVSFMF